MTETVFSPEKEAASENAETPRAKKFRCCMFALIATAFAVLGLLVVFFISMLMNWNKYDGNYAAVDYRNGKVVIYQAKYRDMTGLPDKNLRGVGISRDYSHGSFSDEVWDTVEKESANGKNICGEIERKKALSRVVYGNTPRCYADEISPAPLVKDQRYYVVYSHEPETKDAVWFRLSDCEDEKEKMCLSTNSPHMVPGMSK